MPAFFNNPLAFLPLGSHNFLRAQLIFGAMGLVKVKNYIGSTSSFYQVEDGVILKSLVPALAERDAYKLTVEKKILERLDEHPRIVKYVVSAYL